MPAAAIDQIFRFEENLVAAALTALNADPILGDIAHGNRELEALPKNRIDAEAAGFAKASEQQVFAQSAWWDQHYSGTLTLRVRTQRGATAQAADHAERVGRLRYLMSPKAQLFTTSNLPYYEVLSIELAGTTFDPESETDTDITELTFTVHLGLLASAFP